MLRIGAFSRLAHVTVKTLRHYAEVGLFKPVWIDRFTGYRYYQPSQLQRLDRIRDLKELGFTLDQVSELLDDSASPEYVQQMLRVKQAELEARLAADRARLGLIAANLAQVTADKDLGPGHSLEGTVLNNNTKKESNMQPEIVSLPAFDLVGMCYQGKPQGAEIPNMWDEFLQRMDEVARVNDTVSYGICTTPPGLPEGHYEYVAGVEVKAGAVVPEGMVLRHVPAMTYASFAHMGKLATLGKTFQWVYDVGLPEAGLQPLPLGLNMEVYTDEFKGFMPDSILYIYIPIKQPAGG